VNKTLTTDDTGKPRTTGSDRGFSPPRDAETLHHLLRLVSLLLLPAWAAMVSVLKGRDTGSIIHVSGVFAMIAGGLLAHWMIAPDRTSTRRTISSITDPIGLGAFFYLVGTQSAPAIALLTLMPIGTAIRFGMRRFFLQAVTTTLVVVAIFSLSPEWSQARDFAIPIAMINILVWIYAGVLISRILEARRRISEQTTRDPLTGLINRRMLIDHMKRMMMWTRRSGRHIACFYIDLDGFKDVNDTHGHGVGDRLLCTISEIISSKIRNTDVAARLGGDEFIIVAECDPNHQDVVKLAQRILDATQSVTSVAGIRLKISMSIGVTFFRCDAGRGAEVDPDALIHKADLAMYQAKRDGKNRIHVDTKTST
jgi:diguanylate cyclase (GGDEF)-like protein